MPRDRGSRNRRGRKNDSHLFLFRFIAALALFGIIFSRRGVVAYLNALDPILVLGILYVSMFSFMLIAFQGLTVFGKKFGIFEAVGATTLIFAMMIVWNQVESPWAAIAINRDPSTVPSILYATEDGVVWIFYERLVRALGLSFPILCIGPSLCLWSQWYDLVKDLTYVVTPILLTLVSVAMLGYTKFHATARERFRPDRL